MQLVVVVDGGVLPRAVEIALWRVGVVVADISADIVDRDAVSGQCAGIDLHAHGGAHATGEADQADAVELGEFLRDAYIGQILHLRQLQCFGGDGERDDGRVGRVDLGVDGRRRQIGWQQAGGGVDGGLHLLLGHVQRQVQREL